MRNIIDLTGRKFGKMAVIGRCPLDKKHHGVQWLCKCECGNTKVVSSATLRRGFSKSCGCSSGRVKPVPERVGHLEIVSYAGIQVHSGNAMWNVLCDCGKKSIIVGHELRSGKRTHCGCQKRTRLNDLTGKQFGHLTVIERAGTWNGKLPTWKVRCDCGLEKVILGSSMVYGGVTSCGCQQSRKLIESVLKQKTYSKLTVIRLISRKPNKQLRRWNYIFELKCECGKSVKWDLRKFRNRKNSILSCGCTPLLSKSIVERMVGKKFGKLTVLEFVGLRKFGTKKCMRSWRLWKCRCDCGGEKVTATWMLTAGACKSCGCLEHTGRHKTHGLSNTPEYTTCMLAKAVAARNRLPFHKEWQDVAVFLKYIGKKPEGYSLKLIVEATGYVPGNIAWMEFKNRQSDRDKKLKVPKPLAQWITSDKNSLPE